jgi:hypothetical protein
LFAIWRSYFINFINLINFTNCFAKLLLKNGFDMSNRTKNMSYRTKNAVLSTKGCFLLTITAVALNLIMNNRINKVEMLWCMCQAPKGLNVINPVQTAKGGAARGFKSVSLSAPRRGATIATLCRPYGAVGRWGATLTPSCGFALHGVNHILPLRGSSTSRFVSFQIKKSKNLHKQHNIK